MTLTPVQKLEIRIVFRDACLWGGITVLAVAVSAALALIWAGAMS